MALEPSAEAGGMQELLAELICGKGELGV